MKGYEVSIMKNAMEILGHPAGPVRPPLSNVTPADQKDLEALMAVYADVV
jgi:5-dehydro-4-deoxyglucarate dehydratase